MNKSNKHFEIHFEKLTQRQWQSKEFPVCESVSVISMEIESELEEKNVPMWRLDLMQSRHNATHHLFWRHRTTFDFRQRYPEKLLKLDAGFSQRTT